MRKLLLLGLLGCWSSSPKPASAPKPTEPRASTGGATYGGVEHSESVMIDTGNMEIYGGLRDDPSNPRRSSLGSWRTGSWGTDTGPSGTGPSGTGPSGTGPSGTGYGAGARQANAGPAVSLGLPHNKNGVLDRGIIRRYVTRHRAKILDCYEKGLVADPSLSGTMMVYFTIEANGNVANATASGVSPDISACVANVIATIAFPPPKGDVESVAYPVFFTSPTP